MRGRLIACAALAIGLTGAPGAGAASATGNDRPPTAAEVRTATERFLDRHALEGTQPRRGPGGTVQPPPAPPPATIFPANRVVSLYGAPQLSQTIVGLKSPQGAANKLVRQSTPYANKGLRPVIGEIDLIATIATAGPGPDRRYRTRQDDAVIAAYLAAARSVGARLMLDIQPGRSTFLAELTAVQDWLAQPDVDLALDPEWNVGHRGVPGRTEGSATAKQVNKVSLRLEQLIAAGALPPKLLVVHQFRRKSVRGRGRLLQRPGVELVLNFDGIGSPPAKVAGYAGLSSPTAFNGFSLFYRRDRPLMSPTSVLGLLPEADFLLYQ